jgi:hypothetical protein
VHCHAGRSQCGLLVQGIQLAKHLKALDNPEKQRAEVAVYFKQFDHAEKLYQKMDRPDLAIEMRMRLGKLWQCQHAHTRPAGVSDQLGNAVRVLPAMRLRLDVAQMLLNRPEAPVMTCHEGAHAWRGLSISLPLKMQQCSHPCLAFCVAAVPMGCRRLSIQSMYKQGRGVDQRLRTVASEVESSYAVVPSQVQQVGMCPF